MSQKQIKSHRLYHIVIRCETLSSEDEKITKNAARSLVKILTHGACWTSGVKRKTKNEMSAATRFVSGEDRGKKAGKYHFHFHVEYEDYIDQSTYRRNLANILGIDPDEYEGPFVHVTPENSYSKHPVELQVGYVKFPDKSPIYAMKGKCWSKYGYTSEEVKIFESQWTDPKKSNTKKIMTDEILSSVSQCYICKEWNEPYCRKDIARAVAVYYQNHNKWYDEYHMKKIVNDIISNNDAVEYEKMIDRIAGD